MLSDTKPLGRREMSDAHSEGMRMSREESVQAEPGFKWILIDEDIPLYLSLCFQGKGIAVTSSPYAGWGMNIPDENIALYTDKDLKYQSFRNMYDEAKK